ncbi:MAG TPA: DUF1990 domain-containing protein [Mycobacteriales bacterium]|nr:DUF1990 domain-containing protein [Mycobacteriales bacterium]
MRTVWRPTPSRLRPVLVRASAAELTYAEVGAAAGELPAGYTALEQVTDLGAGASVLPRVGGALLRWELHREARMVVAATDPDVRVGGTVVSAAPAGPLALLATCRVVAVLDGPDRMGFAYGSLPGHPLVGEEQLSVELSAGRVVFRIRSFSRPVGLAGVLPAAARTGQRLVNRRYAAAARRLAA